MHTTETSKGKIQEVTLNSKHLGTAERIIIYTPERYSPLYSYPVLYVQDGDDYLSLGRLASHLDQLSHHKEMTDVIAVLLPVEKEKRRERYYPDGAAHHAYKRFVAEEVVSYIDENYATHPLGSARTLLGESLGGVVSLFTALTYPHTFGQVASQSGAFDDALINKIAAEEPFPSLNLYLEVGTEEKAIESWRGKLDLVAANQQLVNFLHTKGATLAFETFEGDHTWGYWQAQLPRILRYFFG